MTSRATGGAMGHVGVALVTLIAVGHATGRPPPDPAIAYLKANRLRVMNADGTNAREIYGGFVPNGPSLSWSPDGGSITFIESLGGFSLSRIDVDVVGGVPQGINRVVLLADPGASASYWAPAWSPLGDESVFQETQSGALITIPSAGGAPQTLLEPPVDRILTRPAWSPDGSFIAFSEDYFNSPLRTICILNRATGLVTIVLGPVTLNVRDIDWARTHNTLLFEGELQGATGIYVLTPIAGATPQFLRTGLGPSWSPDDSALALWEPSNPNKKVGGSNPYVVKSLNLATGLTTTLGQGQFPEWRR